MENQNLKEHYLQLIRLMCPSMSGDKSDHAKLVVLQKRTSRLIEMLTLFEHSWAEEIPVLQKACLSYLAEDTVPRKEREKIIDAWASWSDFQFKLTRYRGLLAQFLQYHHRTGQELESLLSTDDVTNTETSTESLEADRKGGI